jgi:hypothetical protein
VVCKDEGVRGGRLTESMRNWKFAHCEGIESMVVG